jgi:hypothetical protein
VGSKVRLGLSIFHSYICTNPRVLQWFVHHDTVRRTAPFRGRCWNAGDVERHAPYSGALRGLRISQARPKPRRASSFCCGVGLRGAPTSTRGIGFCVIWVCISSRSRWSPPKRLLQKVRLRARIVRRAGYRNRRCAPETLQLCLFVGRGCMSSVTTPEYSAQAHTALRCARVCALILACLRGARN